MGGKLSDHPELNYVKMWSGHKSIQGRLDLPNLLKYDTDWNWLMPVIDKIESLDLWEIDIYRQCCEVVFDLQFQMSAIVYTGVTKIEATYKAVVKFIKWYNTQPNVNGRE